MPNSCIFVSHFGQIRCPANRSKMKVLVTGGSGYIGTHTAVELLKGGHEVLVVDNLSNSRAEMIAQVEKICGKRPVFEKFDLCSRDKVFDFFSRHTGIEGIIHFAAFKAVGESVEKPLLYYHNNLVSLLNILEGMREFSIPHLVFSSSCTVYGQPEKLPVTEDSPVQQANCPYGNTKQISEEIITDFLLGQENFSAILLRYFNPIGAHESALIGELPLGVPNNLMPFITQTAIGIRDYLRVFGNDYNTPDGTAIRDYIHVVDLAEAHIAALERLSLHKNTTPCEVFNVGTGNGFSVLQVIESFIRSTGLEFDFRIAPRRAGDVEQIWADTTKANQLLGWKAKRSLDEMTLSAWEWERSLKTLDLGI